MTELTSAVNIKGHEECVYHIPALLKADTPHKLVKREILGDQIRYFVVHATNARASICAIECVRARASIQV